MPDHYEESSTTQKIVYQNERAVLVSENTAASDIISKMNKRTNSQSEIPLKEEKARPNKFASDRLAFLNKGSMEETPKEIGKAPGKVKKWTQSLTELEEKRKNAPLKTPSSNWESKELERAIKELTERSRLLSVTREKHQMLLDSFNELRDMLGFQVHKKSRPRSGSACSISREEDDDSKVESEKDEKEALISQSEAMKEKLALLMDAEGKCDSMKKELEVLQARIAESSSERDVHKKENEELKESLDESYQLVESLQEELLILKDLSDARLRDLDLLITEYKTEIQDLQGRVGALSEGQETLKKMELELAVTKEELNKMEATHVDLKECLDRFQEQIVETETVCKSIVSERDNLERKVESMNEECQKKDVIVEHMKHEFDLERTKYLKDIESKRGDYDSLLDRVAQTEQAFLGDRQSFELEKQHNQESIDSLKCEISTLREEVVLFNKKGNDFEKEVDQMCQEVANLNQEKATLTGIIEQKTKSIDCLTNEIEEIKGGHDVTVADLRNELTCLETQFRGQTERINQLIKEADEKRTEFQSSLDNYKAEVHNLKGMVAQREKEAQMDNDKCMENDKKMRDVEHELIASKDSLSELNSTLASITVDFETREEALKEQVSSLESQIWTEMDMVHEFARSMNIKMTTDKDGSDYQIKSLLKGLNDYIVETRTKMDLSNVKLDELMDELQQKQNIEEVLQDEISELQDYKRQGSLMKDRIAPTAYDCLMELNSTYIDTSSGEITRVAAGSPLKASDDEEVVDAPGPTVLDITNQLNDRQERLREKELELEKASFQFKKKEERLLIKEGQVKERLNRVREKETKLFDIVRKIRDRNDQIQDLKKNMLTLKDQWSKKATKEGERDGERANTKDGER